MIKRRIIETIEEYDDKGALKSRTTTETLEDDDTPQYGYATHPVLEPVPWWVRQAMPDINCGTSETGRPSRRDTTVVCDSSKE